MKKIILSIVLLNLVIFAKEVKFDFENVKVGDVPQNWKCTYKWEVQQDTPDNRVLSMVKNKRRFLGYSWGFNTCFTKNIKFYNGTISVDFRANSGKIDEGGGIMWRVQDKNNYYIVRFNPLEDNFTYYKVINGNRIELKNRDIKLTKGWHTITIKQNGEKFEGYIDGKKLLSYKDKSIDKSGGVGLWTKTDAKTSFDNLTIVQR